MSRFWRKFIRWLAKKELALDAALAELDKAVALSAQKTLSYIQGHHDGAKEAFKLIEEEVEKAKTFGIEQVDAVKNRKLH
jgi:nitric oxide synthase oxygenase domain/subunit